MKTWAFISRKGGVGRSTLCFNLAALAEQQGEAVCIMDADPQGSCCWWHTCRQRHTPLLAKECDFTEIGKMASYAERLGVTRLLIDTSSGFEHPIRAAAAVADLIVIPFGYDIFLDSSLDSTLELIDERRRSRVVVVPYMAHKVTRARQIAASRKLTCAPCSVSSRTDLMRSSGGRGVVEMTGATASANEIRQVWNFLEGCSQPVERRKAS